MRARHVWLGAARRADVSAYDLQHLIPEAGTTFHKGKSCGAVAAQAGRLREIFPNTDHAVESASRSSTAIQLMHAHVLYNSTGPPFSVLYATGRRKTHAVGSKIVQ